MAKPEAEPSIEEILASIRQIISDDDAPRTSDVDLSKKHEANDRASDLDLSQKAEDTNKPSFADVLELSQEIEEIEDEAEILELPSEEPEPEPAPIFTPAATQNEKPEQKSVSDFDLDLQTHENDILEDVATSELDSLFTDTAAKATTGAFAKLVGNIPVEREDNKTLYADGRITLEDIVKDLMRPMLRQWINDNMPRLVEKMVEKELEKLSRQVRD
jgi:uncharacterized protein